MKTGFGLVTCGVCGEINPVTWFGEKYKIPCMKCKSTMSIHRQRLRKFKPCKVVPLKDGSPDSTGEPIPEGMQYCGNCRARSWMKGGRQ